MRLGRHVGIDSNTQSDRHFAGAAGRNPFEHRHLFGSLDIDASDPRLDCGLEFLLRLAHAAEYDQTRIEAGPQRPTKFASRYDVGSGTDLLEQVQDGKVRVCLDGVVDFVRDIPERRTQRLESFPNRSRVIDIRGSADVGCDGIERDSAQAQHTVPVTFEAGVGKQRNRIDRRVMSAPGNQYAQYALAKTTSAVARSPVQIQVDGGVADRNSGSGMTRMVALVTSLISASTAGSPHQPA